MFVTRLVAQRYKCSLSIKIEISDRIGTSHLRCPLVLGNFIIKINSCKQLYAACRIIINSDFLNIKDWHHTKSNILRNNGSVPPLPPPQKKKSGIKRFFFADLNTICPHFVGIKWLIHVCMYFVRRYLFTHCGWSIISIYEASSCQQQPHSC